MTNSMARGITFTCLLFFLPTVSSLARVPRERRPLRSTQLPFHLAHGTLIVIPGRIGNLRNLRFALDTGTTQTVVDRRVRDRLHLSCRRGGPMVNFNRIIGLEQCILPDIGIGPFSRKGLPVYVAKLTRLSGFLDQADALIGLDVLGASKFTIDYTSDKVVFQRLAVPAAPKDPNDPVCMTAAIQVQGHPIRLIVDTGVQGLLLYASRLRKLVPHLRLEGTVEKVNIGGRMPASRATLPGVRLGKTEANSVVLLIPAPARNVLPGIDGFLGISALHARRITFDFVAKTLTWEH